MLHIAGGIIIAAILLSLPIWFYVMILKMIIRLIAVAVLILAVVAIYNHVTNSNKTTQYTHINSVTKSNTLHKAHQNSVRELFEQIHTNTPTH